MRGTIATLALGLAASSLAGCYRGDSAMGATVGLGEDGDGDGGDEIPAELEPAPAALRLLLQRQHVNAIRDLLGEEAAAVASPPPNFALNGFDSVGASQQALSDAEIDAFEHSARAVTEAAAAAGA